MKFLIDPRHHRSLVATNRDLSRKELSDLVLRNDVVVADLDDCILPSPAKRLAYERLKDPLSYVNPLFIYWALTSARALAKDGKLAESDCWQKYIELFLDTEEKRKKAKQKVEELLEDGKLEEYPGAAKFFNLALKDTESYLLTRNIPEIAGIFKEKYRFSYAFSQAWNKQRLSVLFVLDTRKKYLVVGDSVEDQKLVDQLKFYEGTMGIERFTSIYVAESPDRRHLNENFTINIGRDYRGLVEILRE